MNHRPASWGCHIHRSSFQASCPDCVATRDANERARERWLDDQFKANQEINRLDTQPRWLTWLIWAFVIGTLTMTFASCFCSNP